MLSQIKIYLGAFVGVVIGVLAWLVNYQSKRADNAEEKAEELEGDIAQAKVINDIHKESVKIDEALANESEEDLRAPSDDSRT